MDVVSHLSAVDRPHHCAPAIGSVDAEKLKLCRLRELRAVIDTLRGESTRLDPLLAWILEREDEAS